MSRLLNDLWKLRPHCDADGYGDINFLSTCSHKDLYLTFMYVIQGIGKTAVNSLGSVNWYAWNWILPFHENWNVNWL